MSLAAGPGRGGRGGRGPTDSPQLALDQHVGYIQSLDTVRASDIQCRTRRVADSCRSAETSWSIG